MDFNQPLTATHLARQSDISLDACLQLLSGMNLYGLINCLNKGTRYNKLYWLTGLGMACQNKLREALALRTLDHRFPDIPWDLFSSVCYSHRSAIIKALHEPMQSAAIKRRALFQNSKLRMSANNVRDVMRYLLEKDIVRIVRVKKKAHPRYELTGLGKAFRELLVGTKIF